MTATLFKTVDGVPQLLGSECRLCGHRWFPASTFGCERCGAYGDDIRAVTLSAQGSLLACATVPEKESSFLLASIALNDGPVVRGIIAGDAAPAVGDRLEAFVIHEAERELVRFRRADDRNA